MRSLACVLVLLGAACSAPEMTDEQRAEVAMEIMEATNDFVAGLASLDGDAFVDPFTDAGDLVYVDGGRIYPDRVVGDSLIQAAFRRLTEDSRAPIVP